MGTGEESSFAARYAGAGVLLALVAVFGALRPHEFATRGNLLGVAGNEAVTGIVALAVLVPLAVGTYDLSVGGTMSLAVVQVTWLFQTTHGRIPVAVAVLVVLATAVAAGAGNALLVARAGVDRRVAALGTLGTGAVLAGLAQMTSHGETITRDVPASFLRIGRGAVLRLPVTAFLFGVLALVLWQVVARLPALRADRVVPVAYVTSAVLAATAGILLAARVGSGPPGAGAAYVVPAYAAALLGMSLVRPRRVNVAGTVLGVALLAVAVNGLQLLGGAFWVVDLVQGGALVAGVLLLRRRTATLLARE
jgi:ribose transport system permease protein